MADDWERKKKTFVGIRQVEREPGETDLGVAINNIGELGKFAHKNTKGLIKVVKSAFGGEIEVQRLKEEAAALKAEIESIEQRKKLKKEIADLKEKKERVLERDA